MKSAIILSGAVPRLLPAPSDSLCFVGSTIERYFGCGDLDFRIAVNFGIFGLRAE